MSYEITRDVGGTRQHTPQLTSIVQSKLPHEAMTTSAAGARRRQIEKAAVARARVAA